MNYLEIIAGVITGALCLCLFLYLAYRSLQSGRAFQEDNTRIMDNELRNRHISDKP